MHIVAADTILADLAAELELTPAEASLYLDELLDDDRESETTAFDD